MTWNDTSKLSQILCVQELRGGTTLADFLSELQTAVDGKATKAQADHIADANTAVDLNATFSDTEVETALNALGTKINAILAALETAGILKST